MQPKKLTHCKKNNCLEKFVGDKMEKTHDPATSPKVSTPKTISDHKKICSPTAIAVLLMIAGKWNQTISPSMDD